MSTTGAQSRPKHRPFGGLELRSQEWLCDASNPKELERASELLDREPGFAVLRGLSVSLNEFDNARRCALSLGRYFGQPLWQDELGTLAWSIFDEGKAFFSADDSKDIVDLRETVKSSRTHEDQPFHTDGAAGWFGQDIDVMMLLGVKTDPSGGDSLLLDAFAVFQALLAEEPVVAARLCQPVPFNRPSGRLLEQSETIWLPMFSWERSTFRARLNVPRAKATANSVDECSTEILRALDVLDTFVAREQFQFRLHLEDGDCLLVDDRRVAHRRTAFSASDRTLIRVWLHRPRPTATTFSWPVDMS